MEGIDKLPEGLAWVNRERIVEARVLGDKGAFCEDDSENRWMLALHSMESMLGQHA